MSSSKQATKVMQEFNGGSGSWGRGFSKVTTRVESHMESAAQIIIKDMRGEALTVLSKDELGDLISMLTELYDSVKEYPLPLDVGHSTLV